MTAIRASLRSMARPRSYRFAIEHLKRFVRYQWLRFTLKRISGPTRFTSAADEAVVVALMRNSEKHVVSFIEHHLAMGVRHIVLLDNGSEDASIGLARSYPQVTLLQSRLPFRIYKDLFRFFLMKRFARQGWCLILDIDELFDYPGSEKIPLRALLGYLNSHGYDAVVGYMLEMFSDQPLQDLHVESKDDLKTLYPFYDISGIHSAPYRYYYKDANQVSNEAIQLHWGGIKYTLFGSQDRLTKHPLVRVGNGRILRGTAAHDVYGARVADFSTVLRHYKFVDSFVAQTERAVREQNYTNRSETYRKYYSVLQHNPNLLICQPTSRRLRSVDDLVADGFLVVSAAYRAWRASLTERVEE